MSTSRNILITVNNPLEVAKTRGALATGAATFAPKFTEDQVLSEILKQTEKDLKENKVDATVKFVDPSGYAQSVTKSASNFLPGMAVGAGVVGFLGLFIWILKGRK